MRYLKTTLTVIGAVTVLVLAGNSISLAATGQALLLGKSNSANTYTSVTRTTSGSVLSLKSASSSNSPLSVNGKGKVINLNADKVDGFDGGTRVLTWKYVGAVAGDKKFVLGGLAHGTYLLHYEVYMSDLDSADGLPVNCFFHEGNTSKRGGETDSEETTAFFPALSGSALMTQPTGGDLGVACSVPNGTANWTAQSDQPVRITAIPLAAVTSKGAPAVAKTAARPAAK